MRKREPRNQGYDPKRRAIMRGMLTLAPSALVLSPARSIFAAAEERSLSFHHTHTNEKLSLTYFAGGEHLPDSLDRINAFLRDFRTEEVHPIDPALLDILFDLSAKTGSRGTFEVISGYRSPRTNNMLRGNSNGVAKRSLHMQGKAIDVRLTDVETASLKAAAIDIGRGGVGYYAKSDFIHVDTGRFRTW